MTTATETAKKSGLFPATDFLASLVVFLVALPLCLGIAIASGVPPALGLITGIIGGLVVGSLAGSPLQVSGPAAGLAVIVFEAVQQFGLPMLGVIVLIAGAIQLLAGVLKLGQWFRAISPSVIHGMLAGIGVIIFASQFHVMVDDPKKATTLVNLLTIPESIYKGIVGDSVHQLAALVGVISIATIVLWNNFKPKALRMVPGPLLAVIVGSVVAYAFNLPIARINVPDSIAGSLNVPTMEALGGFLNPEVIFTGVVFAFVASAETLLCATAVDQMHTGERTKYNKELRAQGIGNMLCGVVGALPMTGVIVRSTANVEAGGTTRASAILHGVWLLGTVAALPWLLANIPTSVLAAILVYIGYKLVNLARIRKIAEYGKMELAIYFLTVGMIVAFDLLTGVMAGFALAIIKIVYTFSDLGVEVERDDEARRTDLTLCGAATFLSIPKLSEALESIKSGDEVHIHCNKLDHIDHASLDLVAAWEVQHEATGGTLTIEWDELIHRYSIRSPEPKKINIGSPNSRRPDKGEPQLQPAE